MSGICRSLLVSLATVLLISLGPSTFSQGGTGEVTGTVYDQAGAIIEGATVTLVNAGTGTQREMKTTGGGVYRFSALPVVGTYTLTVTHAGFRPAKISNVVISVGLTSTQDVHLEIGAQTESIVVEAGAELVTPSESQLSQLVDQHVWQNLPLEIRNQNTFINLVAGAVPNQFGGTTRGAAVNGARPGMGNFLVEGFDNNDQGQGGRGSEGRGAVTSISPEAIQEYRVITHGYDAEYGKGGAFITDTVLRSGTNQWHGSAFEYNRVQKLAANDFFSNKARQKDALVRNQFGGSGGGPILKDRWFFYSSYEGHRRRQSAPLPTTTGVTQQFIDFVRTGAFASFMESDPGGFCVGNLGAACPNSFSQSRALGPIFTKLLQTQPFPLAQSNFTNTARGFYTTTNGGRSNLTYPVPVYGDIILTNSTTLNQHRVSFKSDYKISPQDNLTGTFLYSRDDSTDKYGGGDGTIGPAIPNVGRTLLLGLAYTRTFTPSVLNQFRASYLRHRSDFPNPPGTENVPSIVTFLDPLGVSFGNTSALPQLFTDTQFQYKDDFSVTHGRHSFRFGGEYRRTRNGSSFQATKNGLFEPWGVEELLTDGFFGDVADELLSCLGKPQPCTPQFTTGAFAIAQASINPLTGDFPEYYRGYRANEVAWYLQDQWKIHPRLTVNLGLRWEYFGPPHNFRKGLDSNVYFGSPITPIPSNGNPFFPANSPMAARVAGAQFIQVDQDIWHKDTNNFGPRVGFAWDIFGTQKFVLRGGGGYYYDRIWNNLFENIRFNAPFFAFSTLGFQAGAPPVGPLATPGVYGVPFTNPRPFQNFGGLPSPRHMDQNLVTPYTQQANLGVQWGLAKDFVLEVDGAYTGGRALTGIQDINTYNGRIACTSATAPRPACLSAFNAGLIPSLVLAFSRINRGFFADNFRSNAFGSNYYGLQTSLTRRFSNGLQFNANYTWSHALDSFSDAFNNGRTNIARPTDNFNQRLDKGSADFDVKHRFVFYGYYDLPFLKSNRWLGGWFVNGIVTYQTGVPIPIYMGTSAGDLNRDGYNTDRPLITGDPYVHGSSPADAWLTPTVRGVNASFAIPTCPVSVNFGLWCDSPTGRNTLRAPGFSNTDLGVGKNFRITESARLRFQANFFDVFNHPNFDVPTGNVFGSGTFGRSTRTYGDLGGHRITQLALRIDF